MTHGLIITVRVYEIDEGGLNDEDGSIAVNGHARREYRLIPHAHLAHYIRYASLFHKGAVIIKHLETRCRTGVRTVRIRHINPSGTRMYRYPLGTYEKTRCATAFGPPISLKGAIGLKLLNTVILGI